MSKQKSWKLPDSPDAYRPLWVEIKDSTPDRAGELLREAAERDFWFFCRYVLKVGRDFMCAEDGCKYYGQPMLEHPYIFKMCRAMQADPDWNLDLHGRYHLKSTLITGAYTLWELAKDSNLRFLIMTYKAEKTGEGFLKTITSECEKNEILKYYWPETFWQEPKSEAPVWNSREIILKRSTGAKEPSVLVCGIGSPPVSMHFDRIIWDDLVTEETVSTPGVTETITNKWKRSAGLQAQGGKQRMVGTRWAMGDSYEAIMESGLFKLRHWDCEDEHGGSRLHPGSDWLDRWRLQQGDREYAIQMRNTPVDDFRKVFDIDWLQFYETHQLEEAKGKNVYYFVDPSSGKKRNAHKGSNLGDYTAIIGMALGPDGKYYIVDIIRERLKLAETIDLIFEIDQQWLEIGNPVQRWYYEQFGAQRDLEVINSEKERRKWRHLKVVEFRSGDKKESRIERLQPYFQRGDIYLPKELWKDSNGGRCEMTQLFVDQEYRDWTVDNKLRHDDMLDALAFAFDPEVNRQLRWPAAAYNGSRGSLYTPKRVIRGNNPWAA